METAELDDADEDEDDNDDGAEALMSKRRWFFSDDALDPLSGQQWSVDLNGSTNRKEHRKGKSNSGSVPRVLNSHGVEGLEVQWNLELLVTINSYYFSAQAEKSIISSQPREQLRDQVLSPGRQLSMIKDTGRGLLINRVYMWVYSKEIALLSIPSPQHKIVGSSELKPNVTEREDLKETLNAPFTLRCRFDTAHVRTKQCSST
ncbi:hypothetical protein T265_03291 [Opisthorchis viverrini]|uniref:Uncharacterized protein n=1 Tax=Opisthorchis viverrini TaxID=6198 RepID=A0A075AHP3_OPIVI|nr:hypothetical protein T265_03291 [Opisthorchis viverrini]KER30234.1 hypothetical protein T265_03291 [Opisthorchis viverrini]